MKIKTGRYNSPMGNLVVDGAEGEPTAIILLTKEWRVRWAFSPDGTFKQFSVSTHPQEKETELEVLTDEQTIGRPGASVLVCEHISPGYKGVVFRREVFGTIQLVCPDCVEARLEIAQSGRVAVISEELWNKMSDGIVVQELDAGEK